MTQVRQALLLFGFGIVLQACLRLGPALRKASAAGKLLGIFLLSFFICSLFFTGRHAPPYDFDLHWKATLLFFIVIYSILFQDKILPTINEKSLLAFNLIFLYLFFRYNPMQSAGVHWLVLLVGLASGLVLINALVPFNRPKSIKVILYAWYLTISIGILILNIDQAKSLGIFISMKNTPIYWMSVVSLGMLACNLGVDIVNVCTLIPALPASDGKNKDTQRQSWQENLAITKMHMALLSSKYEEAKTKPLENFLVLFFMLSLFFIDHYYIRLNTAVLLVAANISIITLGFLFSSGRDKEPRKKRGDIFQNGPAIDPLKNKLDSDDGIFGIPIAVVLQNFIILAVIVFILYKWVIVHLF